MRAPSRTPAGIFTENFLVRRTLPDPWHVGHGVSTTRPEPPHRGHGRENENGPWFIATAPVPLHWGHVTGLVPGAAPEPRHVSHVAGPLIWIGTVVPFIASSKEILTWVSRSGPLDGPRRRPPPPNSPPKRSQMSPMSPGNP